MPDGMNLKTLISHGSTQINTDVAGQTRVPLPHAQAHQTQSELPLWKDALQDSSYLCSSAFICG